MREEEGEEEERRVHGALQQVACRQADQQRVVGCLEVLVSEHHPAHQQVGGQAEDEGEREDDAVEH